MNKGLRLTEKWMQRALWLIALVFAAAVILAAATPAPERPTAHQKKPQAPTDVLSRVRARAARSIDRTFGEDAPLARALLIADQHPGVVLEHAHDLRAVGAGGRARHPTGTASWARTPRAPPAPRRRADRMPG